MVSYNGLLSSIRITPAPIHTITAYDAGLARVHSQLRLQDMYVTTLLA
jgi:hypothetical protein